MIGTLSLSGSDSRSLLREFEHCGLQHLRIHETTQTMSLCHKRTEREIKIRDGGIYWYLVPVVYWYRYLVHGTYTYLYHP
jgi:hypothetical protein